MKLFSKLAFLACLLFSMPSYAANPASVPHVTSIAALKTLGASSPQYPSVIVDGFNTGSIQGGGYFNWNPTSTVSDNGCTVFQATGVTTGRWYRNYPDGKTPVGFDPIECGAYGDGFVGAGVANGTTTYVDSSGGCNAAYAAGQRHIVLIPKNGTADAQLNTTFTCASDTNYTMASAPAWSGTGLAYWRGHDDGTAFTNALALANVVYSKTLYLSQYQYLITSLPNGLGDTEASIIGQGTTPLILLAGLNSGADGITLDSFSPVYQNWGIDDGFAGQDCIEWKQATGQFIMKNITVIECQRDGVTFDTTGGVESGTIEDLNFAIIGRSCLMVNLGSGGYVNTTQWTNINCRGASERVAGGAAFFGHSSGGNFDNNNFTNFEIDAQYGTNPGSQNTYAPKPNPIYLDGGGWIMSFTNVTPENTGGPNPCSTICSDIYMNNAGGVNLRGTFCQLAGGGGSWGGNGVDGCVNSFGVLLPIANNAVSGLLAGVANDGMNGIVTVENICGAGASQGKWSILNVGGGTSVLTQIGSTATVGGGATFAMTAPVAGGQTVLQFQNLCGSTNTAVSWYYQSSGEGLLPPYWVTN